MAYVFEKEKVATFKFVGDTKEATLSLNGINGENTAPIIVQGIQGLLYIGNLITRYEPTDGVRTVKEDVNDDS